jgi:hypothetical protein
MNSNTLQDALLSLIPALLIAGLAYYFFKEHIHNENKRRSFLLQKNLQKEGLPIRLQAYERLVLFLERISPPKLLIRTPPTHSDKNDYEALLIATIQQEFEHNLSQQIYISDACWNVILAAKNGTIQLIRKANIREETDSANKLREVILTDVIDKEPPSSIALSYIKKEVSDLWF